MIEFDNIKKWKFRDHVVRESKTITRFMMAIFGVVRDNILYNILQYFL